jgi:pantoate--beta-alanine ligase
MIVLKTADEARQWSREQRTDGHIIGFVPTMGFLHEAHMSLVDIAHQHSDKVIVSIFVNPTQFGPGEDFDSYPRDEERDLELCRQRDVGAVWMPTVDEMYPEGYSTFVEVHGLDANLCGAGRPGHFRGVTTIVSKLFNVTAPDVAVFGRKDAQQARIIQRMTADMQFGIKILLGPILREADGLAMSSRNVRLTPDHRAEAPVLLIALKKASDLFIGGVKSAEYLIGTVRKIIQKASPSGVIEYVEIVGWDDLQPRSTVDQTCLLALAVRFGNVRLIDNILLEIK